MFFAHLTQVTYYPTAVKIKKTKTMHFKTLARTTVGGKLENERFSEKKELNEELKLEKKKR